MPNDLAKETVTILQQVINGLRERNCSHDLADIRPTGIGKEYDAMATIDCDDPKGVDKAVAFISNYGRGCYVEFAPLEMPMAVESACRFEDAERTISARGIFAYDAMNRQSVRRVDLLFRHVA